MLSTSTNPYDHTSWTFHGVLLPGQQITAGVSLLFRDSDGLIGGPHLAFVGNVSIWRRCPSPSGPSPSGHCPFIEWAMSIVGVVGCCSPTRQRRYSWPSRPTDSPGVPLQTSPKGSFHGRPEGSIPGRTLSLGCLTPHRCRTAGMREEWQPGHSRSGSLLAIGSTYITSVRHRRRCICRHRCCMCWHPAIFFRATLSSKSTVPTHPGVGAHRHTVVHAAARPLRGRLCDSRSGRPDSHRRPV